MREAAGPGLGRALRGLYAQNVLAGWVSLVAQDLGVFEEDGVTVRRGVHSTIILSVLELGISPVLQARSLPRDPAFPIL